DEGKDLSDLAGLAPNDLNMLSQFLVKLKVKARFLASFSSKEHTTSVVYCSPLSKPMLWFALLTGVCSSTPGALTCSPSPFPPPPGTLSAQGDTVYGVPGELDRSRRNCTSRQTPS
ncbi:unnamed protein product, partial [Choristocarpus tenellus]